MYRLLAGEDRRRRYYYRCFGNGPQRKGCGNMVDLAVTEAIVIQQVFENSTEPYKVRRWVRRWVEGPNWDDEISTVKEDLRQALEAERFEDMPALQARLVELRRKNSEEAEQGHYEFETVRNDDGSVMTVGEHFNSLDYDAKREYLKTHDIRVEKATAPIPQTRAIRLVIDGEDLGVFVTPLTVQIRPATVQNP